MAAVTFTDYILETFVDGNSSFSLYLWTESLLSDPRTTNGPEAFHRNFNSQFYTRQPNCFGIINTLIQIEKETFLKICSIKENIIRKEDSDNVEFIKKKKYN
jgi:hypothetical protein